MARIFHMQPNTPRLHSHVWLRDGDGLLYLGFVIKRSRDSIDVRLDDRKSLVRISLKEAEAEKPLMCTFMTDRKYDYPDTFVGPVQTATEHEMECFNTGVRVAKEHFSRADMQLDMFVFAMVKK